MSDPAPLVTIITPTYRRDPAIVKRCLDCVKLQTEQRWLQWLIEDGQPTRAIANLCANDERHEYSCYAMHAGDFGHPIRAYKLALVTTPFVCFLDDDNVILPTYLERMLAALRIGEACGFAVCSIVHFGPLPGAREPAVITGNPIRTGNIDTLQVLARTPVMQACGWSTGGYCADGATFERLATMATPVYVPEVLGFHL